MVLDGWLALRAECMKLFVCRVALFQSKKCFQQPQFSNNRPKCQIRLVALINTNTQYPMTGRLPKNSKAMCDVLQCAQCTPPPAQQRP